MTGPRSFLRRCSWLMVSLAALSSGSASTGVLAQQSAPSPLIKGAPIVSGTGDVLYQEPFIDIDEWRDAPVRHRYVHGGFKGTGARFSFYFPAPDKYQGRFFQHIDPVPGSENTAQSEPLGEGNKIGFALASGGYYVETNGGGAFDLARDQKGGNDSTVAAYRANAAAAQYSRAIAAAVYGRKQRPYGYAWGGSGGAYRTIGAAENTDGVWDGFVPYVMGSYMAVPNVFSVRMQAQTVLHSKFPAIVDAMEPGGSGDPYATLDPEEKAVLREATRMGFPPVSWFGYKTMGIHGFVAIYQVMLGIDPSYFTDFWTKPGYLGYNPPEWMKRTRIQHATTVKGPLSPAEAAAMGLVPQEQNGGVDTAFQSNQPPPAFRLATPPKQVNFLGGDLFIKTGAAAGQRISLKGLNGDVVIVGIADPTIIARIKPGDEVVVDNSNFLAAQTYHRHQVPTADFKVWDQFRRPDGAPMYPQRPALMGPMITQSTSGSLQTGKFKGKMIVVSSLWDREAFPWQADWYRKRVEANLGAEANDNFRLYYTDHALHGDELEIEDPSRVVRYLPMLHQALRDISAWVERGIAPPPSTSYRVVDGQVIVPTTARERAGLQPVATLKANGAVRTTARVGQRVSFSVTADTPRRGGSVVALDWDFEGKGTYATPARLVRTKGTQVSASAAYAFTRPGTYFVGVRVTAQRQPGAAEPYARIVNLDRVRVIVR